VRNGACSREFNLWEERRREERRMEGKKGVEEAD
jgi:hypothetical protein